MRIKKLKEKEKKIFKWIIITRILIIIICFAFIASCSMESNFNDKNHSDDSKNIVIENNDMPDKSVLFAFPGNKYIKLGKEFRILILSDNELTKEPLVLHTSGIQKIKYNVSEKGDSIDFKAIDTGEQTIWMYIDTTYGSSWVEKYGYEVVPFYCHWSFDKNLNDYKGERSTYFIKPSFSYPNYAIGKYKHAFNFDFKAYIEVRDMDDITTNDFSISCWIKTNSKKNVLTIIDKREDNGYHMVLFKGRLLFQLDDDKNGPLNYWGGMKDTNLLNDGEWHFVAVTIDRDNPNGMKFYIDNKLCNIFNPISRSGSLSNKAHLLIGKHKDYSYKNYSGQLDELRIIEKVLPENEIAELYNKNVISLKY